MSKKLMPSEYSFEESVAIDLKLINDRWFTMLECIEEIHPGFAKIYNEKLIRAHKSSLNEVSKKK